MAVEEIEVCRGYIEPWRGQRTVEETEGHREDSGQ